MTTVPRLRRVHRAWALLALVAGYVAVTRLAIAIALVPSSPIPVVPTVGLAIAGLVLLGFGAWPAVFGGAVVVNLLVGHSLPLALGVAAGDTLAAGLGAWLLTKHSGGLAAFDRIPDVVRFGAIAGVIVPALSAVTGVLTLAVCGLARESVDRIVWSWWVASACQALVVTPAMLLWIARRPPPERLQRPVEAGVLAGALALVGLLVFGAAPWTEALRLPVVLVFPLLLWAAIRFGSAGAAVATLVLVGFAMVGVIQGTVFVRSSLEASYLAFACFASVGSLTALTVAAVARERNRVRALMLRACGGLSMRPPRREADLIRVADRLLRTIEEHRRAQRYARVLAETVQEALLVVDGGLRVQAANPAFYRTFWLSPSEVEGRPLFELGGRAWDVPEFRRGIEALLATGQPFEEIELVRPFPAIGMRTFRIDARRVEDGAEGGLLLIALRDLTERRRMEQALRTTERRFQAVAETAGDGIVITTAAGVITFANPSAARMMGLAAAELVGRPFEMLVPDRLRDVQRDELERVMLAGEPDAAARPVERRGLRADGSEFPLELTLSSGSVGDEQIVTAILRDISERKRGEQMIRDLNTSLERRIAKRTEQLERSNRELRQFASIAAHDLQEPLRTVTSYLELVQKRYRGRLDAAADDFIGFAMDASVWMRELVRDLLAYSRVRADELKLEPVASERALDRALANLQGVIDESGATIEHGPLPIVVADESRLVQLFQNLVGNALKFRRAESPRVEIRAERTAAAWTFRVADNGIGIDPRHRDRIFQVFQRLHPRGEYSGTGIGLALCRKIVEEHRGVIGVDSVPGMGSEFHFTLPAVRGTPPGTPGRTAPASPVVATVDPKAAS